MTWLWIFNAVMLLAIAAGASGKIPPALYATFVRGLHLIIGISTPSERQMRWVLVAWMVSVVLIVDGMILLLWLVAPGRR